MKKLELLCGLVSVFVYISLFVSVGFRNCCCCCCELNVHSVLLIIEGREYEYVSVVFSCLIFFMVVIFVVYGRLWLFNCFGNFKFSRWCCVVVVMNLRGYFILFVFIIFNSLLLIELMNWFILVCSFFFVLVRVNWNIVLSSCFSVVCIQLLF